MTQTNKTKTKRGNKYGNKEKQRNKQQTALLMITKGAIISKLKAKQNICLLPLKKLKLQYSYIGIAL
jgi:hypothetical protein